MSEVFDLLKYVIPSVVVFGGTYYIMSNFFENIWKDKFYASKDKELELRFGVILPIRLQAYERLVIFLERINPNSSLHRVRMMGMSASDLQLALVANIRSEFEHNMAQQLYVSEDAWKMVKTVKEEMVKLYNIIGSQMPNNASELDYSKAILEYLMTSGKESPTTVAIQFLKQDAAKYLS
jgi:hypothetical protein